MNQSQNGTLENHKEAFATISKSVDNPTLSIVEEDSEAHNSPEFFAPAILEEEQETAQVIHFPKVKKKVVVTVM